MIIDWHTHVHDPKDTVQPYWQGRCPMTIETVIAGNDRAAVDMSVISSAVHYIRHLSEKETVGAIRSSNEHLARCRDRYPDKVVALATSIPGGGDEHLMELERAVKQDDLRGVLINSSHKGAYPDDDAAKPFFKLVTGLNIPVFIHPGDHGYGLERMKDYRLTSSIGRPADNCLALARLIVRGIFEEFPTLKLAGSHLGGGICEVIGRMNYAYEYLDQAFFLGPYEPMLIKHPPIHYLKMMYLDSACYHAPAAQMALETVGADHFLFGTDSPPMTPLKQRGVEMMAELRMSEKDREKVMGGNAARLLKIHY
ncbi:MAG: hypothetical protein A3G24_06350 [Betaproteobacteria bacterium RIFCSPLOWO2_12_FULL_62_13]|nr:MAG: hypothetical protein A3G24_06350 [Betaproteobacteria bacterium RIFCSPLOWO2_12_FULL_62_13]